jgi:hypothetical protein
MSWRILVRIRRTGWETVSHRVCLLFIIRQTVIFNVRFLHLKRGSQCLYVASSSQKTYGVIDPLLCCVLPSAATVSLLVARKHDAHPPPLLAILLPFSVSDGRCVCRWSRERSHVTLRYPVGFGSRLETWSSFVDYQPEIKYKCIPLKPQVHCTPLPISFCVCVYPNRN